MLKKHMAACLVATLFAAPAFAQSSGVPAPSGASDRPTATGSGSTMSGSPAMQPSTANPSSGSSMSSSSHSSTMAQSGNMNGQFMTQMQPNQMTASDLIGTKVISANNESIGDINDVIVDRSGQAVAAVVGVGGFLGIGEKNVAVPFKALEFASRDQVKAMNNSGNKVSTTGSAANSNVNATGSTGTNTGTASTSSDNEPDRVILRMTKAELQAAPKFDKNQSSSTATGTAAPKQ